MCPRRDGVVALGRRTVEADLQRQAIARQCAQRFQPSPDEQHAVGEHGGRRGGGAGGQNVADVRKQKWLAAGHENLADTELCRFAGDPPDPLEPERAPRRFRRGAHATIVAAQIAVEIRVQPKAGADRAIAVLSAGASP